jgi:hypothetical protein
MSDETEESTLACYEDGSKKTTSLVSAGHHLSNPKVDTER